MEASVPMPALSKKLVRRKNEIIRQVEYYFSDENLPKDAYLLALAGRNGDGKVELDKILAFPRMQRFQSKPFVQAALRESRLLELVDEEYIRRRAALTLPLQVEPNLQSQLRTPIKAPSPTDKPWMTKGMLKPTGFEPGYTEGPISTEDHEIERELYSPENSLVCRIEDGINRFCRNRKMHQATRKIFVKFLRFGGVTGGQGQFGSTANRKQLLKEGCEPDEIDRMTAYFSVDDAVLENLDDDPDGDAWDVDFAELARGFLSAHYGDSLRNDNTISTACNTLRSFYNYFLIHNVCPEYSLQINEALQVCDLAEYELKQLIVFEKALPGSFGVACSTLFGGRFAGLHRNADAEWHDSADDANLGMAQPDAVKLFHGATPADGGCDDLKRTWESNIGLQVLEIIHLHDQPFGKLRCKQWELPYDKEPEPSTDTIFEFVMDKDVLQSAYVGAKIDAIVARLSNGVYWIDYVYATQPSYFTWLGNEEYSTPRIDSVFDSEEDQNADSEDEK